MSRVRVGYLINKQKRVLPEGSSIKIGGGIDTNIDIDRYNEGLDILYKGGGRRNRRRLRVKMRSFKKMTRKIQKGLRKTMQKMKRGNKKFKSKKYIKRGSKKTYKR
jgi:hypothetical protein